MEWLSVIEQRANAATPGTWEYRPDCHGVMVKGKDITVCSNAFLQDEEFIAHSRQDVPILCRAVRELMAEISNILYVPDKVTEHGTLSLDFLKALERAEQTWKKWYHGMWWMDNKCEGRVCYP